MPRDGSGGYSLIQNSWNPAINGAQALPNDWQALINDVATAIQGSLAADGQTAVTGVMNFQNNRISQVGAPIGAGDVLRWEQLIKGPDIASASSIAVPVEGMHFDVTGTTTITTIQDRYPGRLVVLKFLDELTITHSSSLLLPDGVDIETKAGDIGLFLNVSSGVWQCISWPNRVYTRDNILGTVSTDINGPTGALLERTTSSGYRCHRYADGTQIIFTVANVTSADTPAAGSRSWTIPFPLAFESSAYALYAQTILGTSSDSNAQRVLTGVPGDVRTTTQCRVTMTNNLTGAISGWTVMVLAVGRWY